MFCLSVGFGQTTNDYYAPRPVRYGGVIRGPGAPTESEKRFECQLQYWRFNLWEVLKDFKEIIWGEFIWEGKSNLYAEVEKAHQKFEKLKSSDEPRTVNWTNRLHRTEYEALQFDRSLAVHEDRLCMAYIEYKKIKPLWFIPREDVRQDFLAATNKLTHEDWKLLERLETEKEKREKLLKLNLGKMDLEISEAEIAEMTGNYPKPIPTDFKLPKPD